MACTKAASVLPVWGLLVSSDVSVGFQVHTILYIRCYAKMFFMRVCQKCKGAMTLIFFREHGGTEVFI